MSENQPVPLPPEDATPAVADVKRPRKKHRWWLPVLITLPILLIVLILLAPTILSLGFVRSMVAPTLRTSFTPNGRLEVTGWNFGWFSGQRLDGLTLYDDQNAVVAHLNIKTGASIWSLLRGKYAMGDTTVDGDFDARIDPATGRINLLHILGLDTNKSEPAKPAQQNKEPTSPPAPENKSEKLPINLADVSGRLTLNVHGTIASTNGDTASIPFTRVDAGNLVVDLNDIEHGVGIDGMLKLSVNDKPAMLAI